MPHPLRLTSRAAVTAACALALSCAGVQRPSPVSLREGAVTDLAGLASAQEAFFSAKDPGALRAALAQAEALAPEAGATYELRALLARLELRETDEVEHWISAAADVAFSAEGALQAISRVTDLPRSAAQHARYLGLLDALVATHPSAELRAHAAYLMTAHAHAHGDVQRRDRAVAALGVVLPLHVIGGWDNDQGKGFDQVLPPEAEVDLSARYEGALMQIGWTRPPTDSRGVAELREYLAPSRWAVAYAATAVRVTTPGRYELRVATSDPLKVFVDGLPVLEAREVESAGAFDQFVIPLELEAGEHLILLKSAHRTGRWRLFARLTGERGVPVAGVASAQPSSTRGRVKAAVLQDTVLLDAPVAHLPEGSAVRATRRALWAAERFGGSVSVRAAQEAARAHGGLLQRDALVQALWANNERGRTADELTALAREAGESLPLFRQQQARFWMQEGLRARARKALVDLVEGHPGRAPAVRQLAALFNEERWLQEECALYERLDQALPATVAYQVDLAGCLVRERREDKAAELLERLVRARPQDLTLLSRLHHALLERGEVSDAVDVAQRMVAAHPAYLWPRLRLAESQRRAGRMEDARATLARAQEAFPSSAEVRREEAELARRMGDDAAAIEAWQAALARNPDDDAIAHRLDFVAPAAVGPWAQDVPSEEALAQAVAARQQLQKAHGADLAWHLDHEVTQLRSDGSTINVVTYVVTALNQGGRDKLTRRRLTHGGRQRVLHAYSVDPQGHRSEASVRSREVLYRGLEVGSTIVLQYRADAPPSGFLPRYLSRMWFFQGPGEQRTHGEFVLWYPAGQALHEFTVGGLEREEARRGEEVRVSWQKRDVPPLLPEPNMPSPLEVAAHVQITTVPSWDAYQRWEEALLEGALQDSPELDALAQRLLEGAMTPGEKLLRIHGYVMEEIRYQQDYQSFIAGVKPHPASMVVERRYGDCKDKTVLFMTLARKAGLEAHFATVRTRDRGQVRRELPTQQFNHAIVYVPPQEGLPEGRFFDSTADALDLDVLRDDNAGTTALVFDPDARTFAWVPIPWQTPGHHQQTTTLSFALKADGTASGTLSLSARGRSGGTVRRMARNPEQFKQFTQVVAGTYFPGASTQTPEPVEVVDLRAPATVRAAFTAPNAARVEEGVLRLRLPTEWSPQGLFKLADRRLPLVLGTPHEQAWHFEVALPEAMTATRLPSSGEVVTPCLTFRRDVRQVPGGLSVDQTLRVTCERLPPSEYPTYRAQMERVSRLLDEEVVVTPAAKRGGKGPAVPKAR